MSQFRETKSYLTPGIYTYTVPNGVSGAEMYLWGGGGANGNAGSDTTVQTGTNSVTYQSGTTQVAGASGSFIKTSGSGVFTVPPNVTKLNVSLLGGGGGAGGSHSGCEHPSWHYGGKGGGGQIVNARGWSVTPGQQINWSVGAGGAGGAAQATGVAGSPTSFGPNTAYGGGAGRGNGKVDPAGLNGADYGGGNGGAPRVASGATGGAGGAGSLSVTWTESLTQPVYATRNDPVYTTYNGGAGGKGAPGGYAYKRLLLSAGDVVTVVVGAGGSIPTGGTSITTPINYRGGNGGGTGQGTGGGGGGATVVIVNGIVVAVAGGGGGGGGGGAGIGSTQYSYTTQPGQSTTSTTTSTTTESKSFTYSAAAQTWTVPSGVTTISIDLKGAGGGGGGYGRNTAGQATGFGAPGSAGRAAQGAITVAAGDVITVYTGQGGKGGASNKGNGVGGAGGASYAGYNGGAGGNSGPTGTSGAGGGGGGATVILKNGAIVAIAGGGGGGGGAGDSSPGKPVNNEGLVSGSNAGQDGQDKTGNGGGGGGGGGGFAGGLRGAVVDGDNGAYSGSRGSTKVPTNGSASLNGAAGGAGATGFFLGGNGENGSATISWVRNITTTTTTPGNPTVVTTATGFGSAGYVGRDGTSAQLSGPASGVPGQGQDAAFNSDGGGGGGGGGYWGGQAGTSGAAGGGGQGGVSYGTVLESGDTRPGGYTLSKYPGRNIGYPGYGGGAIIEFVKAFNISIKDPDRGWRLVDSMYVKVSGAWKEVLNGWVKVAGQWKPLINSSFQTTTAPVYTITPSVLSINDGGQVTFVLSTTGVNTGTVAAYTIVGITSQALANDSEPLTGTYIVGTKDSVVIKLRPYTSSVGTKTIKIVLDNQQAQAQCTVYSSYVPPGYDLMVSSPSINEGQTVVFTLTYTNGTVGEVIRWDVTGITSRDLSSGTMSGTFIVGSQETAAFTLRADGLTEGLETLTLSLYGKGVSKSCIITDSSQSYSYMLTSSSARAPEGTSVTFSLLTSGPSGTVTPYSISGISQADLSSGSLTGNFVKGSVDSVTVVTAKDNLTEGSETLIMNLIGQGISAKHVIDDTSRTSPTTLVFLKNASWIVPAGVTEVTVTAVGGGGGGGGGANGAAEGRAGGSGGSSKFGSLVTAPGGAGGVGGASTGGFLSATAGKSGGAGQTITQTVKVNPGSTISIIVGAGGAGGSASTTRTGIVLPSSYTISGGAGGTNGSPGNAGTAGFNGKLIAAAGGAFPAGGGAGGIAQPNSSITVSLGSPGGGGGGGAGQVIVTYIA